MDDCKYALEKSKFNPGSNNFPVVTFEGGQAPRCQKSPRTPEEKPPRAAGNPRQQKHIQKMVDTGICKHKVYFTYLKKEKRSLKNEQGTRDCKEWSSSLKEILPHPKRKNLPEIEKLIIYYLN